MIRSTLWPDHADATRCAKCGEVHFRNGVCTGGMPRLRAEFQDRVWLSEQQARRRKNLFARLRRWIMERIDYIERDRQALEKASEITGSVADMLPGRGEERIDYIAIDKAKIENQPSAVADGKLPPGATTVALAAGLIPGGVERVVQLIEDGSIRRYPTPAGTDPFLRTLVRLDDVLKASGQ